MFVVLDEEGIATQLAYGKDRGWYTPGNMLERCFTGECKVYGIAVEPEIGWVVAHAYPGASPEKPKYSAFTEPAHRRKGWCARLWSELKEARLSARLLSVRQELAVVKDDKDKLIAALSAMCNAYRTIRTVCLELGPQCDSLAEQIAVLASSHRLSTNGDVNGTAT